MTINRVRFLRVSITCAAVVFGASAASEGRIRVMAFQGQWTGDRAEVSWATEVIEGVGGFHLYRIGSGGETRVNEDLVCVGFDDSGPSDYRLTDPAQALGDEATYRLDAVRSDGSPSTLGVWTVRFEEAPPRMQALGAPEDPPLEPLSAPASGPALKVMVERPDIYEVSYADIADGLDWTEDADDVQEAIATGELAMRVGDTPVAYLPDHAAQRILFYGWGVDLAYTIENAFWIERCPDGTGLHIERVAPDAISVSPDLTFYSEVRFKERHYLNPNMFDTHPEDFYRWMTFTARPGIPADRYFPVPLEGYASGDVALTVRLSGFHLGTPFRRAEVRFNTDEDEEALGTVDFDGLVDATLNVNVDADDVLSADNQLHIRGIHIGGSGNCLFLNDWHSTAYHRYYAPASGLLLATDGGHDRLGAARFTDPLVFGVTDPHAPVWIALEDGDLPSTHSWAVDGDTEWAFRERDAIASATPIPAGFGDWMLDPANRVDYLVIAPRAFAEPAEALAEYRADMGLRTAVAFYEDICDQFGGGLNHPEAIRAMLAYAHEHWAAAPWMAVLGGRGHHDYLGVYIDTFNPLPALLIPVRTHLRPDDNLLADLTGDGLPDVAIGRIPVQTVAQFNAYIAKVQAYELDIPQEWTDRAEFVAGASDSGGNYTESNEVLAAEVETRYEEVHRSSRDWDDPQTVRDGLLYAFDVGSGIMHYAGHAGYTYLDLYFDENHELLLDNDDALSLGENPVPLFVMMACYAGRFDMLGLADRSLAEALILNPSGGALAVYAASGYSYNVQTTPFGAEFYRLHAEDRTDTLGPALLRARRTQHAGAMRTFNLLGDPALKLKNGDGGGEPPGWVTDFAFWRWETFKYLELFEDFSAPEAVAPGERVSNLMLYATGGTRGEDPPSGGVRLDHADPDEGIAIKWQRRSQATDVAYWLEVSEDLETWETQPADLKTDSLEDDGVMEQLRSRIHRADADRLFIRLRVTADSL